MNPAKAATVVTFPILLTGLIHLNLRELLLQAALYRLAFLQGEADLVETRSVDAAVDDCNLPTLQNAIGADNLNQTFILNCTITECPFRKRPRLAEGSYPTFFPPPFMLLLKTGSIGQMASIAAETALAPADMRGLRLSILGHAAGGLAVLIWAMALGMYKPKAATPYGMRARDGGDAQVSSTGS